MRRLIRNILWAVVATAQLASLGPAADAQETGGSREVLERKPPQGSIARQLLVKFKLKAAEDNVSLSAALDRNRQQWSLLTPEQRDAYRKQVRAFLQKSPDEQRKILRHYEALLLMTPERREAYRRRARWLKAVVSRLSDEQREQLQRMLPRERAAKLIALRDEMVRKGELKLEEPTTRPAAASPAAPTTQPAVSAPTTRPAPKGNAD
jgi:phenylpropionate dioxygenase-like ring-hydroxylating dioxygenase large terminal subunit